MGIKTLALEPEPLNCQYLCKNLTLNGFTHDVEVIPAAAGCPPPRIAEIFGMRASATLSTEFGGPLPGGRQFVPVVSLDDILLKHRWVVEQAGPLLLLVDVEGHEEEVLAGAAGLLARDPKPTWIIEVLSDPLAKRTRPTRLFAMMFAAGYRAYRISDEGAPVAVTDESVPALMAETADFWNYLFIDKTRSY